MLLQESMSYKQLYQLFGYKRELNLEEIFSSLLYSIAPVDYSDFEKIPPSVIAQGDSLLPSNDAMVYLFPNLCKAKEMLPAYLSVKYGYKDMLKIETRLCLIKKERRELASIPWYCLRKKFAIWQKLRRYYGEYVDIKMVFAYLEYRAKNCGVTLTELHAKFKEYAQSYPDCIL